MQIKVACLAVMSTTMVAPGSQVHSKGPEQSLITHPTSSCQQWLVQNVSFIPALCTAAARSVAGGRPSPQLHARPHAHVVRCSVTRWPTQPASRAQSMCSQLSRCPLRVCPQVCRPISGRQPRCMQWPASAPSLRHEPCRAEQQWRLCVGEVTSARWRQLGSSWQRQGLHHLLHDSVV